MIGERNTPQTSSERPRDRRRVVRRQRRFLIGGALILLALAYLAFTVTRTSAVYYLTVPELYGKAAEAGHRAVRVSGVVDDASIVRDSASFSTRFTVSDSGGKLPVVYQGTVPDMFQPGVQVVVEGKLDDSGVFHATSLLTKCPAHFEAVTPSAQR